MSGDIIIQWLTSYFPALLHNYLRVPVLREKDIKVDNGQVFRNIRHDKASWHSHPRPRYLLNHHHWLKRGLRTFTTNHNDQGMYTSPENIEIPDFVSLRNYLQIWSMKKNEDASAKRKPKTSAAQIRVQKGALYSPSTTNMFYRWFIF